MFKHQRIFVVYKITSNVIQVSKSSAAMRNQLEVFVYGPFLLLAAFDSVFISVSNCTLHVNQASAISNWAWSFDVQKMKGQLVRSPTRINVYTATVF